MKMQSNPRLVWYRSTYSAVAGAGQPLRPLPAGEHPALCRQMRTLLCVALVALSCLHPRNSAGSEVAAVSFNRDVQPILSSKCYSCHGFDAEHREADLRLDVFEATDSSGAEAVISAGDPGGSYLIERITADDPELRMPPPHAGKPLTAEEVDLLRQWIVEGARYERHWAFVPPRRPPLPQVSDPQWPRNAIDYFVLAELDKLGLKPSQRATRSTLLRRLYLDLVGLPPTVEELERFNAQSSSEDYHDADYNDVVQRLLDSPHFGERWARMWLDAARYADSDGFEKDKPRSVWMYRNWVIEALNRDMPYDEFVVQQIAGDLKTNPTQDDLVATGFLRNSMINEEGGADPEQFRMEAMFDRMDAIGKSVLGITLQCAQCHTHKYDPLSHTEYYEMLAFFNSCYEGSIAVYTRDEQTKREALLSAIREIENGLKAETPDWKEKLASWEAAISERPESSWKVVHPELDGSGGQKHYLLDDGSVLAAGYSPPRHSTSFTVETTASKITKIRLELMNHKDLPLGGPGRSPYGAFALSEFKVAAEPLTGSKQRNSLHFSTASASVNPPEEPLHEGFYSKDRKEYVTGPVAFAHDNKTETAWTDYRGAGRGNEPCEAVFVLDEPIESDAGFRLTIQLVQQHGGANGNDIWNNNLGRFRFSITSDRAATADVVPPAIRRILAIPAPERTAEERDELFAYWRTTVSEWDDANAEIERLWNQHPRGSSQLVLIEHETPRATYRLDRGDFLSPQEKVSPGVPDFLHSMKSYEVSRRGFAQWLVDPDSPTTARSIVNRVWQAYFGEGLVATADDLGVQTASPSHQELLDWLAVELVENGWSLKHLHRLIVGSATYQQSSVLTPELLERDPANRYLGRGPRFRVDAEVVRDTALTASGLLDRTIGGPSVYPPAPEFLFLPPASYGRKHWDSAGSDRYRRALYTFRYRSVPYPALEVFDAPNGNVSCVRRNRSNTPLQALATLNEPLFFECAKSLASAALNRADDDEGRMNYIALSCVSRPLDQEELANLSRFLAAQRNRFDSDTSAAQKISEGVSLPKAIVEGEFAAWTMLSRVVLNLDETVTKE